MSKTWTVNPLSMSFLRNTADVDPDPVASNIDPEEPGVPYPKHFRLTLDADGARMDGERDRMTGTRAAGTRPGRRITDSISIPRSQRELLW
jgi:hypothetical protein